jgi:hypothetical protein
MTSKDHIRAIKILIEWLQSKDTRKWLKRLNKEPKIKKYGRVKRKDI